MAKNRTTVWTIRLRTIADTVNLKSIPKALKPVVKGFDDLGKKMPRIRYQWLSVMFAGMQLQRIFGGMVRPVAELTGVFEPFKLMLEDMLSPVLEPLADVMWIIYDAFDQLSEPIKAIGGGIIVVLAVLGGLLALFGQLGVSLPVFSKGLLGILGPIGLIIGAVVLLFAAWQNNWFGIRDIVKNVVTNVIKGIKGLINIITEFVANVAKGFWNAVNIVKDFAMNVIKGFNNLKNTIFNIARNIVEGVINFFSTLPKRIWDIITSIPVLGDMIKGAAGVVSGVAGGVASFLGGILGFRQYGGFIPRTGLYMLHAGETVNTPGTGMTFAPNITIHATLTQPMDIRAIADELERHWADRYGVRI